ncbi:hypothetical protein B0H19DRAFT_1080289 [Mycena capillaripes]|nr:hypothetical protein B0H19DRAFT_1080289 [Mycena capillaripes]
MPPDVSFQVQESKNPSNDKTTSPTKASHDQVPSVSKTSSVPQIRSIPPQILASPFYPIDLGQDHQNSVLTQDLQVTNTHKNSLNNSMALDISDVAQNSVGTVASTCHDLIKNFRLWFRHVWFPKLEVSLPRYAALADTLESFFGCCAPEVLQSKKVIWDRLNRLNGRLPSTKKAIKRCTGGLGSEEVQGTSHSSSRILKGDGGG